MRFPAPITSGGIDFEGIPNEPNEIYLRFWVRNAEGRVVSTRSENRNVAWAVLAFTIEMYY